MLSLHTLKCHKLINRDALSAASANASSYYWGGRPSKISKIMLIRVYPSKILRGCHPKILRGFSAKILRDLPRP
jgi:hypothetical protein